jgi:hypothetical protein
MPDSMSTGRTRVDPPPAKVFINPAAMPTTKSKRKNKIFIFYNFLKKLYLEKSKAADRVKKN